MKKKLVAAVLYVALLMTALIPATALASGDAGDGTDPSVRSATELSISGVSLATKIYDGTTQGTVTGHKPGTAIITATAADGSGFSASCTVRVLRYYPSASPITGDSSHLGVWIGVLAVSACAIGAAAFILIKKRKKK